MTEHWNGYHWMDKAEELFLKEVERLENLESVHPRELVNMYDALAGFYYDQSQLKKAEEFSSKSIELYERFAAKDPEKYSIDLAASYYNAACRYSSKENPTKKEELLLKAIKVLEDSPIINSDEKVELSFACFHSLNDLYIFQDRLSEAREYSKKFEEELEKLLNDDPENYYGWADYLIGAYSTRGEIEENKTLIDKAFELALRFPESYAAKGMIEDYKKRYGKK